MSQSDGSVTIATDLDNKQLEKKIQGLEDQRTIKSTTLEGLSSKRYDYRIDAQATTDIP